MTPASAPTSDPANDPPPAPSHAPCQHPTPDPSDAPVPPSRACRLFGLGPGGACRAALVAAVIALIVACEVWVDRPVAFAVHAHALRDQAWLRALTHVPDALVACSVVFLLVAVLGLRGSGRGALRVAVAMAASVAIATFLKDQLKIVFGRAWPETWTHGNPSLIHDHVYGFFWWRFDSAYHSFPSGHTTVTFAVVAVLWRALPSWRPVGAVLGLAVCVGLIGMNYHFVSDVLAGALLGSACGDAVWRQVEKR